MSMNVPEVARATPHAGLRQLRQHHAAEQLGELASRGLRHWSPELCLRTWPWCRTVHVQAIACGEQLDLGRLGIKLQRAGAAAEPVRGSAARARRPSRRRPRRPSRVHLAPPDTCTPLRERSPWSCCSERRRSCAATPSLDGERRRPSAGTLKRSMFSSASVRIAISLTSRTVEGRSSPVSRSLTLTPTMKVAKCTLSPPRRRSFSGSRAPSPKIGDVCADRLLHQLRRDLDDVRLAVDPAAAVGEDVEGVVVLDEQARALEHLEGAAVKGGELVRVSTG